MLSKRCKRALIIGALCLSTALAGCASVRPEAGADTFAQARSAWLERDYEQALILMHAEAERGNPEAQYALGYMYYNGQGTQVDIDKAMEWIQRAARQGHQPAIEALSALATVGLQQPDPEAEPE